MSRRTWTMWFLVLGLVVAFGDPAWFLEAGTVKDKGIKLDGVDALAGTVQTYAKGNVGKMLGMIIAIGGIVGMAMQRIGMGLCGLGAGIALAFVPNMIGKAFDTTKAATLMDMASFMPPAPSGDELHLLAQMGLASLFPLVLALKYGRDPVVWVALGMVVLTRRSHAWGYSRQRAIETGRTAWQAISSRASIGVG
ncbi:MAG: hypothetical protein OXP66_07775 [Candidatus Tectomicrobia bacterium]|nr:hypothetical protein [Candidatus Tectomicrobia bacterium]